MKDSKLQLEDGIVILLHFMNYHSQAEIPVKVEKEGRPLLHLNVAM